MQSLIERFTELTTPTESPLSGMADLEEGGSPEDAELGRSRAQRSMVLQQASQRITQANMSLHKLRTHFHKVTALLAVRSCKQSAAGAQTLLKCPARRFSWWGLSLRNGQHRCRPGLACEVLMALHTSLAFLVRA